MPARDPFSSTKRGISILRLAAAMAVLTSIIALVAVARGGDPGKSHALIIAAVGLGVIALVGMAMLTLPYAFRQKDRNDSRS